MDINYSEVLHIFLQVLNKNIEVVPQIKGHALAQLVEARATSQKVMGLISDDVTRIFN
jgi:hypothetical protein